MKYAQQILFREDSKAHDEIDELFSKLQTIEPPASLIDTILASVAQLPPYSEQQTQAEQPIWSLLHDVEGLVVWHNSLDPS